MTAALAPTDRVPQPPGARLRDYILEDYPPVTAPEGRLHSVSALRFFLRTHGWLDAVWPMIEALRGALGPDETVWGVKTLPDGRPGVELYFYNHNRNASGNPKSVTRLSAVLAPLLRVDSRLDERLPYLMCSLELDEEVLRARRSPGFRVYVAGTRPRQGYDGISYLATGDRLLQENVYCFYRASEEMDVVRERVRGSWRAGDPSQRASLLDPRLLDCFTICFATKAETDALYFSRVSTADAVPVLLERMRDPIAAMLADHADEFAHLRWDVGYDFSAPAGDLSQASIRKIGLYGFC